MSMANQNKQKYQILNYRMHLLDVKKVYDVFESHNISPILIKGLSAALNYPKPFQRSFSDIDLAVSPESFAESESIIKKHQFNVDLHKGLRHLDVLDWTDLFENSRRVELEDLTIRVLRPEDNLRVLCVHWLTDGGADRSRLWDVYFALSNLHSEFNTEFIYNSSFGSASKPEKHGAFDWDRFFGVVDDKRKVWLAVVLLAAEEYLGLNPEEKFAKSYLEKLPEWIKSELESEWSSDKRLIPLKKVFFKDNRAFLQQMRKRIPPNILQSAIETDSEMKFDRFYLTNLRGFFTRSKNSAKDLIKILKDK